MIRLINGALWWVCPHCGKKYFQVSPDAYCKGVFLICKQCKRPFEVKISCENSKK